MIYVFNICPVSGHLQTDLFQIWSDAGHDQTLEFDSSLNDLDVLRYVKARTCALILL